MIFTPDFKSEKARTVYPRVAVKEFAGKLEADPLLNERENAVAFARDINVRKYGDFEREGDLMCHVSTFAVVNGKVYVSYYASTNCGEENPNNQVARLAYSPIDRPEDKKILDIQSAGDMLGEQKVVGVYDTIIMKKESEPENIYVLWTANIEGKYYRLYRIFNTETEALGEIGVNRFKVGNTVNDFSFSGMQNALAENGIGFKEFFADIGIMQKQSSRVENGVRYYYSGTYSGNFTCIIKSADLITWEYVAQPNEGNNGTGFANETKWENAVYVLNDRVYYFVRQWDDIKDSRGSITEKGSPYGVLTYYDLNSGEWARPVLVADCQSRSDFIMYKGELYLFYAPCDREHIGILHIDTNNLSDTSIVLQADMKGSCFYPFVEYLRNGELAMAYTVDRKHIRLAEFDLGNLI